MEAKSVLRRPSTDKFCFNPFATNGQLTAISFATVMQAALIPVAYSVGTDFKPAAVRAPLDATVHGTGGRPTQRQPRPTCQAL